MNYPTPKFNPMKNVGISEHISRYFHKRRYAGFYTAMREVVKKNLPFLTEPQVKYILPALVKREIRRIKKVVAENTVNAKANIHS